VTEGGKKEREVKGEKTVKGEELGQITVGDGALGTPTKGVKREADSSLAKGELPAKKAASLKAVSPAKERVAARGEISATSNAGKSPQGKGNAGREPEDH
jgi:hypothetical protein